MIKKSFTLHQYQQAFQRNIAIAVRDYGRTIACSATGSGKTKTFIDTAAKTQAKGRTVLIMSESIKIFRQIQDEITATEIADGKNYKSIHPGFIYLAMAQTLQRRPHLIEQFNALGNNLLVIVDEAHVGTGAVILKTLSNALMIGFTATPEGKHLREIYRHCVVGPQPHELVVNGYLCGYTHIARERADIARLRMNSAGDDYSEESQEEVFESKIVYEGLIEDLRTVKFSKGLIYCASINDCEHTYATLTANGFTCARMHTRMHKDQIKDEVKKFERGLTPLMINVAMLTKGYDYPPVDLIVLKLKTKKLSKYIQMLGRGSRILQDEMHMPFDQRTKQKFTGLDYGQNWKMHYQWDYEHDWAELWQGKPPKRPGVPPIKYCPQCEFLMPASAKKCSNCGYEFVSLNINIQEEQPETVLIEVTSEYTKITNKKLSELTPQELAVYARQKNKKQYAMRIARAKAQAGDVDYLRAYGAAMGYKWQWAQRMLDDMPAEKIEYNDFIVR
jgi:superfamily II DNA or RNA helicase